jgi:hypothetical protein
MSLEYSWFLNRPSRVLFAFSADIIIIIIIIITVAVIVIIII